MYSIIIIAAALSAGAVLGKVNKKKLFKEEMKKVRALESLIRHTF